MSRELILLDHELEALRSLHAVCHYIERQNFEKFDKELFYLDKVLLYTSKNFAIECRVQLLKLLLIVSVYHNA